MFEINVLNCIKNVSLFILRQQNYKTPIFSNETRLINYINNAIFLTQQKCEPSKYYTPKLKLWLNTWNINQCRSEEAKLIIMSESAACGKKG